MQGMNLSQTAPLCSKPTKYSVILQQYLSAPPFGHRFHYRSVIRKINFLEHFTSGNKYFVTHQVAQFCKYPCFTHGSTIKHLNVHLRGTRDDEFILDPNRDKSFEVYADADFCGN